MIPKTLWSQPESHGSIPLIYFCTFLYRFSNLRQRIARKAAHFSAEGLEYHYTLFKDPGTLRNIIVMKIENIKALLLLQFSFNSTTVTKLIHKLWLQWRIRASFYVVVDSASTNHPFGRLGLLCYYYKQRKIVVT